MTSLVLSLVVATLALLMALIVCAMLSRGVARSPLCDEAPGHDVPGQSPACPAPRYNALPAATGQEWVRGE